MIPKVVKELSYDEILERMKAQVSEMVPTWRPAEGDTAMLVLRALAYRELYLRAEFNALARAFFLPTATGSDLDALATTLYGMDRIRGARPRTSARFTLLVPLPYAVTVPEGFLLLDETGLYRARLTQQVRFEPGETEKEAPIELEKEVAFLDVACEIQATPLPYLKVEQLGPFEDGSDPEEDERFRERILANLARKSTAGSALTYRGYALGADERIEDVAVFSPNPGVVRVVYWAPVMDDAMQERVERALNDETVRPLTDKVEISRAVEVPLDVNGTLLISDSADAAKVYLSAVENLRRTFAEPKIGKDVSLAKIIDALMIEGVRDVRIDMPSGNVKIDSESIAVLRNVNIGYGVGDEL
jgi:phage-related baseplate assembly protein